MTAPSNEARSPWASTATVVTSASPIISAAAVDAVRPGLRIAFEPRKRARDAADARRRPAEHRGERPHQARRHHRDADEQPEHAGGEQKQPVPVVTPWPKAP